MAIDINNTNLTDPMGLLDVPQPRVQIDPMQVQQMQMNQAQQQLAELERRRRAGSFMLAFSDVLKGRDPSPGIMERQASKPASLTAAQRNFQYAQTLPEPQRTQFLAVTGAIKYDPEAMRELEEAKRKGKAAGGLDLTPGQRKADENFAKVYNTWQFEGEKQQAESNIRNLDNKLARLATGQENVSGRDIGLTPEILRPFVQPEATSFLDEVNDIVFQSLRATLGAQFTQEEGKRLVAATFNQALPEEFNRPRLQRLSAKIKSIYKSKQDAIDYFNEYDTLAGFKQEPETFDDILDAVYFDELRQLNKEQITDRFKKARTPEERQTILRFAEKIDKESGQ